MHHHHGPRLSRYRAGGMKRIEQPRRSDSIDEQDQLEQEDDHDNGLEYLEVDFAGHKEPPGYQYYSGSEQEPASWPRTGKPLSNKHVDDGEGDAGRGRKLEETERAPPR